VLPLLFTPLGDVTRYFPLFVLVSLYGMGFLLLKFSYGCFQFVNLTFSLGDGVILGLQSLSVLVLLRVQITREDDVCEMINLLPHAGHDAPARIVGLGESLIVKLLHHRFIPEFLSELRDELWIL
jgi:hypothetical protein